MTSKSSLVYRSGRFASGDLTAQAYVDCLPPNLTNPAIHPEITTKTPTAFFYDGLAKVASASKQIRAARTNRNLPPKSRAAYSPSIEAAKLELAFNDFKIAYPHLIKQIFDRSLSVQDRLNSHLQTCKLLDCSYNALRKYEESTGINFGDQIKAFEIYRSDLRSAIVEEFDQSYEQDYFPILMLNEISGINDDRGLANAETHEDLGDMTMLGDDLLDAPASNRLENCTRTALVTMAAMFGSKSGAPAGYDDMQLDKYLRIAYHEVFQEMALVPWQKGGSFDAMFAVLDNSPENSFNFLRYGYKNLPVGHITVGANVNGRACIVEGQNNSVITQNRDGTYMLSQAKTIDGTVHFSMTQFDSSQIVSPIFLPIERNDLGTDFDRSKLFMEKLYERANQLRAQEMRNAIATINPAWRDDDITVDRPKAREYFNPGLDDDPGDHLQQNPMLPTDEPATPITEQIVEPKVRGLFD